MFHFYPNFYKTFTSRERKQGVGLNKQTEDNNGGACSDFPRDSSKYPISNLNISIHSTTERVRFVLLKPCF
jgi:hypothetical protein